MDADTIALFVGLIIMQVVQTVQIFFLTGRVKHVQYTLRPPPISAPAPIDRAKAKRHHSE